MYSGLLTKDTPAGPRRSATTCGAHEERAVTPFFLAPFSFTSSIPIGSARGSAEGRRARRSPRLDCAVNAALEHVNPFDYGGLCRTARPKNIPCSLSASRAPAKRRLPRVRGGLSRFIVSYCALAGPKGRGGVQGGVDYLKLRWHDDGSQRLLVLRRSPVSDISAPNLLVDLV
jgi:hypothetical protein